jgi:mono/diheme cytochrome c family protein
MQTRSAKLLFVGFVLVAAGSARAQDVTAGKRIAEASCNNCHVVGAEKRAAGNDAAPTFLSIAQMPSTTEMSLAAFLSTPHRHMPDLMLSRAEIRDVSGYILSLRKLR